MDNDPSTLDSPITRATIDKLTVTQLDDWLESIRDRRLSIVRRLEDLEAARHQTQQTLLLDKFNRELERTRAAMGKLDDAVATVEKRITKLRAMEMDLNE